MSRQRQRLFGRLLLTLGTVMLVTGIVLMITVDTVWIAVMLFGSILVNTAAITLLRYAGWNAPRKKPKK
ncbi:MAG TPA: hypothetical protein GX499_06975 [Clostridiales bacterium]|nr:hypothetical protein [Clostridiales bacterium]